MVQGRFLALCGFGNLPGDITFLDKKADGKCKVISQVRYALLLTMLLSACSRSHSQSLRAQAVGIRFTFSVWMMHINSHALYYASAAAVANKQH